MQSKGSLIALCLNCLTIGPNASCIGNNPKQSEWSWWMSVTNVTMGMAHLVPKRCTSAIRLRGAPRIGYVIIVIVTPCYTYILRNCGSILSNACSARHCPWWPWMMTRAAYQLGWQWYMHRSMSGPWTVRRYAPYAWYAQADLWQGQKISRDVKICQDMLQLWSFPCHLHDFKNNQLALSLATSKGLERVKSPFCKLR